jgi:hypothetical protein
LRQLNRSVPLSACQCPDLLLLPPAAAAAACCCCCLLCGYSLNLKLAHDIGYWDTWPDAIGEDMHMFIKCFLRTNGATRLHPIHAPINMTHVQGEGYIKSLCARFYQVRAAGGNAGGGHSVQFWGGWQGVRGEAVHILLTGACCWRQCRGRAQRAVLGGGWQGVRGEAVHISLTGLFGQGG